MTEYKYEQDENRWIDFTNDETDFVWEVEYNSLAVNGPSLSWLPPTHPLDNMDLDSNIVEEIRIVKFR